MRTEPDESDETLGSPYRPFPDGVDESAGGADSSPFENEPTEDRKEAAEEEE